MDAGTEAYFGLLDLGGSHLKYGVYNLPPTSMYKPIEPLMDKVLLKNRQNVLVKHLTGLEQVI